MGRVCAVLGWLLAVLAALFLLLGIASWPPGGLMFALPYVFLFAAVGCAALGSLLIRLGRRLSGKKPATPPPSRPAAPRE